MAEGAVTWHLKSAYATPISMQPFLSSPVFCSPSRYTNQVAVMNQLLSRTPIRRILTPSQVTTVTVSEYDSTYVSQKIMVSDVCCGFEALSRERCSDEMQKRMTCRTGVKGVPNLPGQKT